MLWSGLIGPAYTARSPNLDAEVLRNLYLETISSPGNAKKSYLIGTPGLVRVGSVDTLVCRGLFQEDGRAFAVIGDILYELFRVGTRLTDGVTAVAIGSIGGSPTPVSFASNGRGGEQLAIVGGGQLHVLSYTSGVLTAVALPLTNAPVMVDFMDGYFLLLERDTIRVWFSALEDGTSWSALDFFARSQTSDNLVGMKVLRDRIWLLGSLTTEVYYDSGDTDNPFVPYPGSVMQIGLTSPWALGLQGDALVWLAQDTQGNASIVSSQDYAPQEISTPAVSFALSSYVTLTDAEVLVYEQEAHNFACFTFPSGGDAGVTWAFDAPESITAGQRLWHQRSFRNVAGGTDESWRARGFCAAFGGLLVGDRANGNLYALDLDTYEDDEFMIRRVRRAPYLGDENQWVFIDQIEIGIQAGVGLLSGQGVAPVLELRLSRDSAHTWDPYVPGSMGAMGVYDENCSFYQLGRARLDRLVAELVVTDPVKTIIGPGAYLRVTPGSGMV